MVVPAAPPRPKPPKRSDYADDGKFGEAVAKHKVDVAERQQVMEDRRKIAEQLREKGRDRSNNEYAQPTTVRAQRSIGSRTGNSLSAIASVKLNGMLHHSCHRVRWTLRLLTLHCAMADGSRDGGACRRSQHLLPPLARSSSCARKCLRGSTVR